MRNFSYVIHRSISSREEVGDRHKAKHKHKRRRTDPAVARFFELEAVLSGSDSGDDEGASDEASEDSDGSGSSNSTQLSGDFINDGTYTQHSPQGEATQYGMYLAVNNYHSHMRSPDDFVRGKHIKCIIAMHHFFVCHMCYCSNAWCYSTIILCL